MTITFESDNDVIVYALEKIISHARRIQQIFVAQTIWWISSIIGLETNLVTYIDTLHGRTVIDPGAAELESDPASPPNQRVSPVPRDNQEDQRRDMILKECEEYLKDSRRLREIAALTATGKTLSGFINPTAISKKHLKKKD
jgi:hypothetical protein